MARATDRPFGVSFAAGWAAITGLQLFFRAFGGGLFAAIAPSAVGAALGLAFAVLWFVLGLVFLVVAGGLYRVQGWARLVAIVLFGLFTLFAIASLASGNLLAVVGGGLHATALVLLVLNRGTFESDRPDIDDSGSASRFGT